MIGWEIKKLIPSFGEHSGELRAKKRDKEDEKTAGFWGAIGENTHSEQVTTKNENRFNSGASGNGSKGLLWADATRDK